MFKQFRLGIGMLAAGALLLSGCGATANQDTGGGAELIPADQRASLHGAQHCR